MPTFSDNQQTPPGFLPSNFFQYQQQRQNGPNYASYKPKGKVTTTKASQAGSTQAGGPGPYTYTPGSVARPDGRPSPGGGETQPPPPPPPPKQTTVQVTPDIEAKYGVPAEPTERNKFYAGLNNGTPVQGMPGATWQHNGQGWTIVSTEDPAKTAAMNAMSMESTPAGMEYLNAVKKYDPTQISVEIPEMYAGYDPRQFDVDTPEMFSKYLKTNFSGIKLPDEYEGYQKFIYNTKIPTEGYKAGDLGTDPFTSYVFNPENITQFESPDQSMLEGKLNNLMSFLFENPTSMSDKTVAQMREKQKEASMALQENQLAQNAETAAARGIFGGGGQAAQDAAIRSNMNKDLLTGYRDIDLKKAEMDFKDRTAVAELGDAIMSGQMDRATKAYNALLAGQKEREAGLFNEATSKHEAEKSALTRAIEGEKLKVAEDTSAQNLAELGLSKEELEAAENKNAFDAKSTMFKDFLAKSGLQKEILDSEAGEAYREYTSGKDIFDAGMDKAELAFNVSKANADEGYRGWLSNASQYKDALAALGIDIDVAKTNISENQFSAANDMQLGTAKAGLAESDATRALQKYLAEKGFDIDEKKIQSNYDIANMGNQTDLYGINTNAGLDLTKMALQNKQFYSGLNQDQGQFDATMGFNKQGQADNFFKWLIEQGGGF